MLHSLTCWIQGLSRTCGIKFKDFQAPVLFSRTFRALNLGEKIQVLLRTFKDVWKPCVGLQWSVSATILELWNSLLKSVLYPIISVGLLRSYSYSKWSSVQFSYYLVTFQLFKIIKSIKPTINRWRKVLAFHHHCYNVHYSVSQKNIPDIFSCNFRKHCRIFIMSGTHVTEKVSNQ